MYGSNQRQGQPAGTGRLIQELKELSIEPSRPLLERAAPNVSHSRALDQACLLAHQSAPLTFSLIVQQGLQASVLVCVVTLA
jgi:hypothetical protein